MFDKKRQNYPHKEEDETASVLCDFHQFALINIIIFGCLSASGLSGFACLLEGPFSQKNKECESTEVKQQEEQPLILFS